MLTQKPKKSETLKKIEHIESQIAKLKEEHALLKESLMGEIIKLLHQKHALSHDFETLVGGIISVIDTLKKENKNNDDENNNNIENQKQIWKKIGGQYFTQSKKNKESVDKLNQ
jgi:hypothetical protein